MATRPGRYMPPYEVMSSMRAASQAARQTDVEAGEPAGGPVRSRWWTSLGQPLVLRLPRGYAILTGAAFLALMLLAYWVGHLRGFDAAAAEDRGDRQAEQRVYELGDARQVMPLEAPPGGPTVEPLPAAEAVMEVRKPGRDPRQEGLNYFVLAHDEQKGAMKLLTFLWHRGVDAAAFRYDNTELYSVVALDRGFGREQIRGEAYRQYERKLDQLGRKWEAAHPGGVNFKKQGMYAKLHTGANHLEMITRKGRP